MDKRDFTLIDDFFNGTLPENEAAKLRDRASTDGELAREMALRAEMEGFLKSNPARLKVQGQLAGLGQEFFEKKMGGAPVVDLPKKPLSAIGGGRRFWLAVAAAGALLVAAVFLFKKPDTPQYAQFSAHDQLNLTVRSAAAGSSAEAFFNKKDYPAALGELEKLAAERPEDGQVATYRAICLIEVGRTADARAILQPLADGASAWAVEARWYLAMSFLKDGELAKCREALRKIGPGDNHFGAAQKILG